MDGQGNSGQRDREIDEHENTREQCSAFPERATRLGAQPLSHPGDNQRKHLTSRTSSRSVSREQRRIDDLIAMASAMVARERPASDSQ
jgi:hypothetical protein